MIDTGKYTGHTPAPWDKLSEYCPVGSIDKQLIADAPLLLAEVKRLREQLKEANDVIQYALEMSSDDDSTRVFEDYLEVIE
jgi:hypothetical protein|tara:strand:- start:234 stop:476 length:243 start_codon:yes stop_codon:yes gene_type:complete